MTTRKQAAQSVKEYLRIYGYTLTFRPTSQKTADGRTIADFTISGNGKEYGGMTLDDVVQFVRRRVPEALLCGYQSGVDSWEELKPETKEQLDNRNLQEIEKAIEVLRGILAEMKGGEGMARKRGLTYDQVFDGFEYQDYLNLINEACQRAKELPEADTESLDKILAIEEKM